MDEPTDFAPARKLFLSAEYDTREGDVPVDALVTRLLDLAPVMGAVHGLLGLPDLSEGQRFVDLGTGAGAFALSAALVNPRAEVVGVDISPGAVAAAARAAAELGLANARFEVGDFEARVPEADAVLVAYALSLASDPARVLANVAAALRPGGRLVVFDAVLPRSEHGPVEPDRLDALAWEAGLANVGRSDLTEDVRALAARGAWPWSNAPAAEARFVASAYRPFEA